jgi:hypothetical protein
MAGWPERRACLSVGWARRRAYRRTYKRTQVVRAVDGPAAYERRARCAPPVESGQPSAYELIKFGPVEHHAYHSMILVACAIVTNRVPVLAGPSQAEFEGSYQSDSSTGYRRAPSAPMAIWHHHWRGGERRPVVVRGFAVPAHGLVRRANTRRSPTSRVEAPSTSQLDTPLLVKGGGGPCFSTPPPHVVCDFSNAVERWYPVDSYYRGGTTLKVVQWTRLASYRTVGNP